MKSPRRLWPSSSRSQESREDFEIPPVHILVILGADERNERDRCEACAPLLIRPRTLSDTSFVLSWERDNLRWYRSALVWARAFPGRELVRRPVEVSSTVHGGGGVLMRRKKWSANDGDCEMDCSHLDATCNQAWTGPSIERTSATGRARHGHVKEIVARLHV